MRKIAIVNIICGLLTLVAAASVCQGYQNVESPVPSAPIPSVSPLPPLGVTPPSTVTEKPIVPKSVGVDQLLDKLESLKAKREAIEQEEKATRALLQEKLKLQQERMGKLGVRENQTPSQPPVIPDAVPGIPRVSN